MIHRYNVILRYILSISNDGVPVIYSSLNGIANGNTINTIDTIELINCNSIKYIFVTNGIEK